MLVLHMRGKKELQRTLAWKVAYRHANFRRRHDVLVGYFPKNSKSNRLLKATNMTSFHHHR